MSEKTNVFENLARPIRKLLTERGFTEPTLPQSEAIPKILEGKNILLIAPSGTGKTESAFLPILHKLLLSQTRERGIKILYITPLRALNRDMLERLEWWCRSLDLRVSVRHGDTKARERRAQALFSPDVMITTPETLQILLLGRRLSQHLRSVQCVVVDEVHELAESKRGAQLSLTLERLRELKGGEFQLIGLSATIGSPKEVAQFLVGVGRQCEIVDVSVARELELNITFPEPTKYDEQLANKLYTFPSVATRLRVMRKLIEQHSSTLIFTNTRPTAEILGSRFRLWDIKFPISVHHGSLSSLTRLRVERELKQGKLKSIICTSSMELGIDVGMVDLVIQYNSPRQVTRLLQRVGRSGHKIGEVSKGVIVVQDPDDAFEAAVIAARSHRRELEPVTIPEKPFDVLFHSLVSMIVAQRRAGADEAYRMFRRAYPFRNLTKEDIVRVLNFAQSLERRLLWLSEGGDEFSRSRSTQQVFDYYFNNLSMIPDFRQYLVMDDVRGKPVGILDESFVAEYGKPGVKFVIGGKIWRIVQVFKDKVYVKQDKDSLGAIPTWIGEEIPVPYSVAQGVGEARSHFERLVQTKDSPKAISELAEKFGVDCETMKLVLVDARKQVESGLPLPTDRRITIEKVKSICVVNASFGTLVNRTLARLLVHTASSELGEKTATSVDPYRILLRSKGLKPQDVVDILRGELSANLKRDLKLVVEEGHFFRWRLAQVARRMGVLKREAELTSSVLDKLIRALRGTPAFEEAFKEVVHRDLDLERTLEVLGRIKSGEIKLVSFGDRSEPSPISGSAWRQRYLTLEPMTAGRLKLLAIASAKTRLLSEIRTFACTQCKRYVKECQIYELDEQPKCPHCKSTKLGMIEESEDEVQRAIELVGQGRKISLWQELLESSKLISKYGKPAALALAARGVDSQVARGILMKERKFSNKFLELVLLKEREALFKRFKWA